MKIILLLIVALTMATGSNRAADVGPTRQELQRRSELLKDFDAYVQLKKYPEAVAVFDTIAKEGMFPEYNYSFLPKAILALAKVGQDQRALATIDQFRKGEVTRKSDPRMAKVNARFAYEMMMVRSLNETHAALPSGTVKSELGKLLAELPKEAELRAKVKSTRSTGPNLQK